MNHNEPDDNHLLFSANTHSQNANNPEHLVSDSDQCFANAVLYTGLSESCSLVITFLGSLNALKPGAVFSIPAAMMKRYLSSGEKKKKLLSDRGSKSTFIDFHGTQCRSLILNLVGKSYIYWIVAA